MWQRKHENLRASTIAQLVFQLATPIGTDQFQVCHPISCTLVKCLGTHILGWMLRGEPQSMHACFELQGLTPQPLSRHPPLLIQAGR